jgi:hypothetical protein
MGTNYYTKENECKACGEHEEIHLGKSSCGWQFTFQYNKGRFYKSVPEMKKWTKDKIIKNEYGETISDKKFWDMVKGKQKKENLNHAKEMHRDYPSFRDTEYIIGGYSFSDGEFS